MSESDRLRRENELLRERLELAEKRTVVSVNDEAERVIGMPHTLVNSLESYLEITRGKCACHAVSVERA